LEENRNESLHRRSELQLQIEAFQLDNETLSSAKKELKQLISDLKIQIGDLENKLVDSRTNYQQVRVVKSFLKFKLGLSGDVCQFIFATICVNSFKIKIMYMKLMLPDT